MRVSYNRFFKLLIDKRMKKMEVCKKAGISTTSIGKMAKDQNLTVDILVRICSALDCKLDDIIELIPEDDDKAESAKSE